METTVPPTDPPATTTPPTDPPVCDDSPLPGEPVDGDGDGLVLDGTASERTLRTYCEPFGVATLSLLPATR